ncbi:diguanylate cyclase (GGDEF) domain-containing protein [Granulicella pectinivorans]|uniref:diguanylate cyclase n=1 Tax=Granulicella pectinivorans TaxID=474950 RepID=A0A1I6LYH8_9BACT|nr:diguanylate cyclase [Granulicella pectinivorans]SFS08490.1 diguanylate cyclase (GGDEF) domain-containing protein [Granulicella pectinivorans]
MRSKVSPRLVISLAAAIFGLHIVAALFVPDGIFVTSIGLIACHTLAWYVAIRQSSRVSGTMRRRWTLVSVGFALGVLGFSLTLYRQCVLYLPDGIASLQHVALLLRGLPFLMAVVLSKRERSPIFVRLDFAQGALAIAVAFIAFLFAFPNPEGGFTPVSSLLVIDRLAAANLIIALAATFRLFAAGDTSERRFIRIVCGFLWSNALLTGFVNLIVIHRWQASPGSALLVLGDIPVLAMAVVCSLPEAPREHSHSDRSRPSFLESGSSFLFPFAIFLMAASIVPIHFYLGMICVTLSFVLYAVRSTILQTRYLAVQEQLRTANERVRDQALLDGLTGIPNRRSFDQTLSREWKRAQRTAQPMALLLLDVDFFKRLNDTYGHLTGDVCLVEIAGILRTSLAREVDFAARYGGEEFAVLLAGTGPDEAWTTAEMLRRNIEKHRFELRGGEAGPLLSVSIGIASIIPMPPAEGIHDAEHPSVLIAAADEALYTAKRQGRNRCHVYDDREHEPVEHTAVAS